MPRETLRDRIAEDLRRRIRDGEFPPGSRLPKIRELQAEYKVSKVTVQSALDLLRWEKTIIGHQGKGVYVPPIPSDPV